MAREAEHLEEEHDRWLSVGDRLMQSGNDTAKDLLSFAFFHHCLKIQEYSKGHRLLHIRSAGAVWAPPNGASERRGPFGRRPRFILNVRANV